MQAGLPCIQIQSIFHTKFKVLLFLFLKRLYFFLQKDLKYKNLGNMSQYGTVRIKVKSKKHSLTNSTAGCSPILALLEGGTLAPWKPTLRVRVNIWIIILGQLACKAQGIPWNTQSSSSILCQKLQLVTLQVHCSLYLPRSQFPWYKVCCCTKKN